MRQRKSDGVMVPTKMPVAIDGTPASSTDPSTWTTRPLAEQAVTDLALDGLAFALTTLPDGTRLAGLDSDRCYPPDDDALASWAQPVHALLDGHFSELSPSGAGRHHLFLIEPAKLPEGADDRVDYSKGKRPDRFGFELYLTSGRYFTYTGRDQNGELQPLDPRAVMLLVNQLEEFAPPPAEPPRDQRRSRYEREDDHDKAIDILDHTPNRGGDYVEWLKIVGATHNATGGSDAGLRAIEGWTEKGGYDSAECRVLWRYFNRKPPRRLTIAHLINEARERGYEPYPRGQRPRSNGYDTGYDEPLGDPAHEIPGASARIKDELGDYPDPTFITAPELVVLKIPKRRWLLGRTLLRGNITGLIGGGAVGKSSLILGFAVSIITGRDLIGDTVHEQGKCWVHNCEDDRVETRRRLAALLQHHEIPDNEIVGQLAISTGLDHRLTIAMKTGFGGYIDLPHVKNCIDFIKTNGIIFAAFDPFIGLTRGINENDNADVDAVCDGYRRIAYETGATVLVAQHTGKPPRGRGGADPGDPMVSRGAVAFVNGMRIAQQLTTLDKEMARDLDVTEGDHFRYLRRDDGKLNFSLKTGEAIAFYERKTVRLENGDDVGVIIPSTIGKKEPEDTVTSIKANSDERALLSAINLKSLNGTPLLAATDPTLADFMARPPRNWKPKRLAKTLKECHFKSWIVYRHTGRNRGYHLTDAGKSHLTDTT